jgi:hypothetical protein
MDDGKRTSVGRFLAALGGIAAIGNAAGVPMGFGGAPGGETFGAVRI